MRIFISHSKEDNPIVYRILKILGDNKIPNWVDLKQIDTSSYISEAINHGISSSSHFMLIWSKNASKSQFVRKEYNAITAPDYCDKIVPIILKVDNTQLPPLLADRKYHSIEDEAVGDIMDQIINEINKSKVIDSNYKKFDDYLDAEFGTVNIASHKYATSLALKNTDHQIYKEDMMNWIDNLDEVIN